MNPGEEVNGERALDLFCDDRSAIAVSRSRCIKRFASNGRGVEIHEHATLRAA